MTTPAAAPTVNLRVVIQTYVVAPPRRRGHQDVDAFHYEIQLAPDDAADAPRTIVVTRDREMYERALKAEATGLTFKTSWHRARRDDGRQCLVLDVLEVA